MKKLMFAVIILLNVASVYAQDYNFDQIKIKEDLNDILNNVKENYVYLEEKDVDLNCIREYYEKYILQVQTEEQKVLFFEYLLYEFYDSHLILNTNRKSSFRLFSPIYATVQNGIPTISNVWQTQIKNLEHNLIGAELLKINKIEFKQAIQHFPTHCNEKSSQKVEEWIANKILAGRYNEPRILTLKLKTIPLLILIWIMLNSKWSKSY